MPIKVIKPRILYNEYHPEHEEKPVVEPTTKTSEDYHGGDEITQSMKDQRFAQQQNENQTQLEQQQNQQNNDSNKQPGEQQNGNAQSQTNGNQQTGQQNNVQQNKLQSDNETNQQNNDNNAQAGEQTNENTQSQSNNDQQNNNNNVQTEQQNETKTNQQQNNKSEQQNNDAQQTKENNDQSQNNNETKRQDDSNKTQSEQQQNSNDHSLIRKLLNIVYAHTRKKLQDTEQQQQNNNQQNDEQEEDETEEHTLDDSVSDDYEEQEVEEEEDDYYEEEQEDTTQYNTQQAFEIDEEHNIEKQLYLTFYRLVEYLSDEEKQPTLLPGQTLVLNVKKLMMRQYERKPINAYYYYRTRSQVVLILDNSGSMTWLMDELSTFFKAAVKRKDVIIYVAPNGHIEEYYNDKTKISEPIDHDYAIQQIIRSGLPVIYVGDFDGANTPIELSWTNRVYWICTETRYKYFSHHDWVGRCLKVDDYGNCEDFRPYYEDDFKGFFGRAFNDKEIITVLKEFAKNVYKQRFWYDKHNIKDFSEEP